MNLGLLVVGILHLIFGLLILLFPKFLRILIGGYLIIVGLGSIISSVM